LIPALALQDWISADAWWIPLYDPRNWLLFAPHRWPPEPQLMSSIVALSAAVVLMATGLGVVWKRMPVTQTRRSELAFWIAVSLGCLCLMAGVVPWIWDVGLMARVQFPWRLMSIVEFAIITGLCVAPLERVGRAVRYIFVLAALAIVPAFVLVGSNAEARFKITLSGVSLDQRDMKPHQPRGFPQDRRTGYDELGLEPLVNTPAITCQPSVKTCRAQARRFGEIQIEIDSDVPVSVTLRRFFFPSWRLEPALPLSASDPFKLVSFTAPAGNHTYRLTQHALQVERWGWAISGLSLLLMLGWVAATRRAQSTLR